MTETQIDFASRQLNIIYNGHFIPKDPAFVIV